MLQKLSGTELEQKLYKLLRFIKVGTDHPSSGRRTALSTTPTPPLEEKPLLLLELGSLAFECGLKQLAEECLSELPQDMVGQPVQWCVRKQVLNCQLKLKEGYSKTAVEGRVQAVNRLEDILTSALRTNDMDLVQVRSSYVLKYLKVSCLIACFSACVYSAVEHITASASV